MFDRDGDGQVECEELGTVLRASNRLPSEAEISEFKLKILNSKKTFSFPDLLTILSKLPVIDSSALRSALLDAFRVFDQQGNGEIGTQELRHIMTSLGEKMTDQEAQEMIQLADPNETGVIKYELFVDKLVST